MTTQWPKRGAAPWDTALRAYIDEGDTPRTGTAAEWTAANTVLAPGEQGYETDTGKRKMGDGVTAWADLPYDLTKAEADDLYATSEALDQKADTSAVHGMVVDEVASSSTVTDAAASAVTTEIAGRSLIEAGTTVIEPVLLLRPEGSETRSGAISPTINGGMTTVAGQYGQAWHHTESTQNVMVNVTGILLGQQGTVIQRVRFGTVAGENYALDVTGTTFRLTQNRVSTSRYASTRMGSPSLTTINSGFVPLSIPDNTWVTLATTWSNGTFRLYVDGVLMSSGTYTGSVTPTELRTRPGFSISDHDTESLLGFDVELEAADLARISGMAEAWTFTNVQTAPGYLAAGAASQATGAEAVALGDGAIARGDRSVAIGKDAYVAQDRPDTVVYAAKDVEADPPSGDSGFIVASSNGTRYRITFTDSGVFNITKPDDPVWTSEGSSVVNKVALLEMQVSDLQAGIAVRGKRTIGLGDSNCIGSQNLGPYQWSQYSWFNLSVLQSEGRLEWLRNAGIWGDTIAGVQSRLDTDVIAHNPEVVLLNIGTNDCAASNFNLSTASAGYIDIVERLRSAGITVICGTLPPRNDGVEKAANNAEFNDWLTTWTEANDVPLADMTSPVEDGDTGMFAAGMNRDTVHLSELGAQVVGAAMAATAATVLPPARMGLARTFNEDTNLITNGLFVGDANSNGVADGWTHNIVDDTATLVADPAIEGNWQQIDATSYAAIYQILPLSAWDVGDVLRFSGRVEVENVTGSLGVYLYVVFTGSGAAPLAPLTSVFANGSYTFTLAAPVPVGTTSVAVWATKEGTGSATFRVAQLRIVNETSPSGGLG